MIRHDHANHLKSVTTGGATYSYAYNGLGDRVSQTVGGVTTHYTLDLNAGLTQVLADGTNTYLYGNERIAQYGAGGAEYFLGDALGSVRQLVDSGGLVTLTRSYKPYGDILISVGTATSLFGFDGELTDSYSKLLFLRARFLSIETGRFITKDVWEGDNRIPISYNAWTFVYANPVNQIDPSGYCIGCDFRSDQVLNFQRSYGIELENYSSGNWTCNQAEIDAIIDGATRIGKKFSNYVGLVGLGPSIAFRQVMGHTITFKLDSTIGYYGYVADNTFDVTLKSNIQDINPTDYRVIDAGTYPLTRLVVHELAHVFSNRLEEVLAGHAYSWLQPEKQLESGIYEKDGKYVPKGYDGNFVTGIQKDAYTRQGGDPSEQYYKSPEEFNNYYYYKDGVQHVTGYQWHSTAMNAAGNSAVEDWADIFQNWVFDSFAGTVGGSAVNDWVETNMQMWIGLSRNFDKLISP